jgi:hypothetical protein
MKTGQHWEFGGLKHGYIRLTQQIYALRQHKHVTEHNRVSMLAACMTYSCYLMPLCALVCMLPLRLCRDIALQLVLLPPCATDVSPDTPALQVIELKNGVMVGAPNICSTTFVAEYTDGVTTGLNCANETLSDVDAVLLRSACTAAGALDTQ